MDLAARTIIVPLVVLPSSPLEGRDSSLRDSSLNDDTEGALPPSAAGSQTCHL